MSDKENPPSSGFSTGQILALSALGIAFIIILVMLVYYWWEVRQERSSQVLATELLDVNPVFAQAIMLRQVACKGDIPKWKPPKSSAASVPGAGAAAGSSGPGLFGKLAAGVGGLAASAKGFLASKGAGAVAGGPSLTNKAKGFLGKVGTTFGNSISKLKTAAGSAASAAGAKIKDAASAASAKVGEKVKVVGDAIQAKGAKLAEDIKKKGEALPGLKKPEAAPPPATAPGAGAKKPNAAAPPAAAGGKSANSVPAPKLPDPQLAAKRQALQELINRNSKTISSVANLTPMEKTTYDTYLVQKPGSEAEAIEKLKALRQQSLTGFQQQMAALK